jgi:hypothetical protein
MDSTPLPPPWRYLTTNVHRRTKEARAKEKKITTKIESVSVGGNYTDEEKEWLRAIQDFLAKHRRYPNTQEAFAIAHALGYRKTEGDDDVRNGQHRGEVTEAVGGVRREGRMEEGSPFGIAGPSVPAGDGSEPESG